MFPLTPFVRWLIRVPPTLAFALIIVSLGACKPDKETPGPQAGNTGVRAKPSIRVAKPPESISLVDVTAQSKIDFVHSYDGHDQRYIVEAVGSGMSTLDFDSDGFIDVYFLNGAPIPVESGPKTSNGLYRNLGHMTFADATLASHTDDVLFSMGVAVADYDSDGFPDIFVTNFGPNVLLRNNGDGTFEEVSMSAGVGGGDQLGAGACFLDADRDGHLDLFVGNYVQAPVEKNIKRTTEGFPSYPGPLDFKTDADVLFHNNGDGSFSDCSAASGFAEHSSTSMGCVAADFDDDGDTDIFVVNDVDRNFLFENDGTGKFIEVGIQRGVAFSQDGKRNGNMGVDCADFDGDGALDFFTTTFSNELPVLYRNDGFGNFADVTVEFGAGVNLLPHANWGASFFDVENDGDQDLVIANGHTDPNVSSWAYTTAWKVANTMLLNGGDGHFTDISKHCGSGFLPVESSRGVVTEDFDADGDLDIIFLNALARPTVIRNDSKPMHHWLQLDLKGKLSSRDGTGTRVTVEVAGKKIVKEVHSGRGYQSSFGQRLHFGLGEAKSASKLNIRWPSGESQVIVDVAGDQILTVVQP